VPESPWAPLQLLMEDEGRRQPAEMKHLEFVLLLNPTSRWIQCCFPWSQRLQLAEKERLQEWLALPLFSEPHGICRDRELDCRSKPYTAQKKKTKTKTKARQLKETQERLKTYRSTWIGGRVPLQLASLRPVAEVLEERRHLGPDFIFSQIPGFRGFFFIGGPTPLLKGVDPPPDEVGRDMLRGKTLRLQARDPGLEILHLVSAGPVRV
jgi:hypothetical protein